MILIYWIIVFLVTVTVHEYAHGRVAYFFGDRTAYHSGRLSFNPLKHIDPFFTVILPLMLVFMGAPPIGMAKPVPVNFLHLRNPKRDMIWVAAAGPCANLLFATILAGLLHITQMGILLLAIYLNVGLAVFNLMPIPPLDGGRICAGLLPNHIAYRFGKVEPFGIFIIMGLLWVGLLHHVLLPIINVICYVLRVPGLAV